MNTLYGNQRKLIKTIYKNYKKDNLLTKAELSEILNVNQKEIEQLCKKLYDDKFIDFVGLDFKPKLTPKGIDYFSFEYGEWLSKNIIPILALIISILSFLRTL